MTGEIAAYIIRNGSTKVKLVQLDPTADDSRIYYPKLEEQTNYPAIQLTDFGEGVDCKDGLHGQRYTTTAIVWAKAMSTINDLIDTIIQDLHHYQGEYNSQYRVVSSQLGIIGPVLEESDKKVIGRPVDFEIQIEKI